MSSKFIYALFLFPSGDVLTRLFVSLFPFLIEEGIGAQIICPSLSSILSVEYLVLTVIAKNCMTCQCSAGDISMLGWSYASEYIHRVWDSL